MHSPMRASFRDHLVGVVAALILLGVRSSAARADLATLDADLDNTLYEDVLGLVSNGAGDHIFAGQTDDNLLRRALVRFPIASAIPSGATINAVSLTMFVSRTRSNLVPVSLYRVTQSWGE